MNLELIVILHLSILALCLETVWCDKFECKDVHDSRTCDIYLQFDSKFCTGERKKYAAENCKKSCGLCSDLDIEMDGKENIKGLIAELQTQLNEQKEHFQDLLTDQETKRAQLETKLVIEGEKEVEDIQAKFQNQLNEQKKHFQDLLSGEETKRAQLETKLVIEAANDYEDLQAEFQNQLNEQKKHFQDLLSGEETKRAQLETKRGKDVEDLQAKFQNQLNEQKKHFQDLLSGEEIKRAQLETKLNEQKKHFQGLLSGEETKRAQLETQLNQIIGFSAFTAKYSFDSKSKDTTLTFESSDFNYGNGFHPKTGQFVAPKDGMYAFIVELVTQTNNCYLQGLIYAESKPFGEVGAGNYVWKDQQTSTHLARLKAGDVVKVVWTYVLRKGNGTVKFQGFLI